MIVTKMPEVLRTKRALLKKTKLRPFENTVKVNHYTVAHKGQTCIQIEIAANLRCCCKLKQTNSQQIGKMLYKFKLVVAKVFCKGVVSALKLL